MPHIEQIREKEPHHISYEYCPGPGRIAQITSPDQLVPAITDALASDEPVFIDVPTRSELEEVPPVHAWQQALQREST